MVIKRRLFGERVFHIPHMNDTNDYVLDCFRLLLRPLKLFLNDVYFAFLGVLYFGGVIPIVHSIAD